MRQGKVYGKKFKLTSLLSLTKMPLTHLRKRQEGAKIFLMSRAARMIFAGSVIALSSVFCSCKYSIIAIFSSLAHTPKSHLPPHQKACINFLIHRRKSVILRLLRVSGLCHRRYFLFALNLLRLSYFVLKAVGFLFLSQDNLLCLLESSHEEPKKTS